ncbi:hypothetical protein OA50_03399 [Mameliella alba]|uniref:Uncharacterized protein n=1 Tax=Mameliella alba TaxID=561184 RepID=A0A0B3RV74_9RHOB|nr:hypothetical protein OA50_03399 [Mameliella alba]
MFLSLVRQWVGRRLTGVRGSWTCRPVPAITLVGEISAATATPAIKCDMRWEAERLTASIGSFEAVAYCMSIGGANARYGSSGATWAGLPVERRFLRDSGDIEFN